MVFSSSSANEPLKKKTHTHTQRAPVCVAAMFTSSSLDSRVKKGTFYVHHSITLHQNQARLAHTFTIYTLFQLLTVKIEREKWGQGTIRYRGGDEGVDWRSEDRSKALNIQQIPADTHGIPRSPFLSLQRVSLLCKRSALT